MSDTTTMLTGAQFTHFAYNPNITANALYITILSCFFILQLVLGAWYRTWSFMGPMLVGIFLELLGYSSRIFMSKDPSSRDAFLMDNITLILGPAFLAASIYLCMGHLVRIYGENLSAIKPRTYLLVFVACDLVNLILQGVGGGISSTQLTPKGIQAGINVVIAGLATQVASLFIFIICCAHYAYKIYRFPEKTAERFAQIRQTKRFHGFLIGIGLATICIFTRSIFRIAELHQGFTGPLANSEVHFMTLEGGMILIATGSLTFLHPGPCFQGFWRVSAAVSNASQDVESGHTANMIKLQKARVSLRPISAGSSVGSLVTGKNSKA